ncbi:MAG: hypothetical protein JKY94_09930, partial [Rhodobacteraceae bacterium]|nr:hypothetical protein [Paracoccaceae bacterium]
MANKKRQTVQYRQLNLPKLLPDGLLGVRRSSGEVERSIAASFAQLANTAGGMADKAAAIEGRRAGRIAGSKEGFRPTGSMSIRGQAHDQSGERVYMQTLEAGLREDMQNAYELHRSDPAALNAAFEAMHDDYQKKHVYPEIAGDFQAGFQRLSGAYRTSAFDAFEKRRDSENQAAMLARLNDANTTLQRGIESLDGGSESGEALISDHLAEYDREIDLAVADDRMTPLQGETAKQNAKRKTTVDFYTNQARDLQSVDDIKALHDRLSKDFAAGKLNGVDGDAWADIDIKFDLIERKFVTRDKQATSGLTKRAKSLADRIADGYDPAPDEIPTFINDIRASSTGDKVLKIGMGKIGVAGKLRDSTLDQGAEFVRGLEKTARQTGSVEDYEISNWARKKIDQLFKDVASDPIGTAVTRGIISDGGDLTMQVGKSAEDYASDVAVRVSAAEAAAQHFGVPVKVLQPNEVTMIQQWVKTNPEEGVNIAAGLVSGGGSQTARILTELGTSAPIIAQVGVVMVNGANRQAAIDAYRGGSKDTAGNARPRLEAIFVKSKASDAYGDVFTLHQEDGHITTAAAHNIARARMVDQGIGHKDLVAVLPIYKRALQEAVGANFDGDVRYGGTTNVNVAWY